MADFHPPGNDALAHPPIGHDRSGSTSGLPPTTDVDNASHDKLSNDDDVIPPSQNNPVPSQSGSPPEQLRQVNDVLSSEIGVSTLLHRLKQSIASAKEFAIFLKKRSTLEEDHAQGLRKLSRTTQEMMRRPEHRQGSFTSAYDEMMHTHERMAENGTAFAGSLHLMHEELIEMATVAERSRKGWKTNGLAAEQKVADMEQTMRKSKTKYDSLADDYERVKSGEARQSGKMFGALKGHKSAAQHEEDLLRKVQAADQTYHSHVQALQNEKAQLVASTRPEAVRALQDLIKETDSAVSMQMQKFATYNEKLLLSNGLSVSPINGPGGESSAQPRSLRQAVSSINNDKDLNDFITSQHRNMQHNVGEIKYERNPVLAPQGSSMSHHPGGPSQHSPMGSTPPQGGQFAVQQPQPIGPGSRTSTLGPLTSHNPQGLDGGFPQSGSPDQARPFDPSHNRSYSQQRDMQGPPLGQQQQLQHQQPPPPQLQQQQQGPPPPQHIQQQQQPPPPQQQQQQFNARAPPQQGGPRYGNGGSISSSGPPQLGALPFQGNQPPTQPSPPQANPPFQAPHDRNQSGGMNMGQGGGVNLGQGQPSGRTPPPFGNQQQGPPPPGPSAPSKPSFGLPLNRLYERDGLAVPMVVYQCIQAVDLFGLGLEGIYRQSGSMTHIQKLKNMFDTESSNPYLDFRNPENFYHDVNSVTGLLKQFFRDLPDPLLTHEHHDSFVAAAKHDDDVVRRDSLHAIINSLPDPNYATLRALTLHLFRVMDNSHVNRMNSHNLAVIFGPTLMGTDPSTAIADAGWQIKVIDTILQNTYQIFDED